jgi:hypothetical protein
MNQTKELLSRGDVLIEKFRREEGDSDKDVPTQTYVVISDVFYTERGRLGRGPMVYVLKQDGSVLDTTAEKKYWHWCDVLSSMLED